MNVYKQLKINYSLENIRKIQMLNDQYYSVNFHSNISMFDILLKYTKEIFSSTLLKNLFDKILIDLIPYKDLYHKECNKIDHEISINDIRDDQFHENHQNECNSMNYCTKRFLSFFFFSFKGILLKYFLVTKMNLKDLFLGRLNPCKHNPD